MVSAKMFKPDKKVLIATTWDLVVSKHCLDYARKAWNELDHRLEDEPGKTHGLVV